MILTAVASSWGGRFFVRRECSGLSSLSDRLTFGVSASKWIEQANLALVNSEALDDHFVTKLADVFGLVDEEGLLNCDAFTFTEVSGFGGIAQLMRAGDDKPSACGVFVDDCLYIAEELRHPLDLINDDVSFELREIGFGILLGD